MLAWTVMLLVVLVGLPASGKSSWLQHHNLPALSSDHVRALLTGDETSQHLNRLIFSTLRHLAAARIAAGAPVTYIDATALTIQERRCWIRFAELHACEIEALFFDTPLEECLRRNSNRPRVVPQSALARMAARLQPPTVKEGFRRVSTIAATTAR